jgi:hypothetical protein
MMAKRKQDDNAEIGRTEESGPATAKLKGRTEVPASGKRKGTGTTKSAKTRGREQGEDGQPFSESKRPVKATPVSSKARQHRHKEDGVGTTKARKRLALETTVEQPNSEIATNPSRVEGSGKRNFERTRDTAPRRPVSLIAAYNVGRWLNELNFVLQQAYFLSKAHMDEAESILQALGRAVRDLVPVNERARLRARVTAHVRALLRTVRGGQHWEDITDYNASLNDDYPYVDLEGRREMALLPVFEAVAATRRSIQASLRNDQDARLAFELGELVDQGIRPADVHVHLYKPPPPGPKYEGPKRTLSAKYVQESRGRRVQEGPQNLLANVTLRAGEVSPTGDWFEEVFKVLEELDLHNALPPEVIELSKSMGAGDSRKVVERVDSVIRIALERRQAEREARIVGEARGGRRRATEWDKQTEERAKYIYGLVLDTRIALDTAVAKYREKAKKKRDGVCSRASKVSSTGLRSMLTVTDWHPYQADRRSSREPLPDLALHFTASLHFIDHPWRDLSHSRW